MEFIQTWNLLKHEPLKMQWEDWHCKRSYLIVALSFIQIQGMGKFDGMILTCERK